MEQWIYSQTKDWTCPVCQKQHSKPHFAFPDQIDYKKKPDEKGRVKFSREEYDDCDKDKHNPISKKIGTGLPKDDIGRPKPLFCSHCGYESTLVYISKVEKQTW